ncbi:MAG: cobalt-precorrin-7 (C(5))-methyltransferase [Flavonifractor plautii]
MKVYLIGVGMGNPATLTGQALEAIGDSPVLVGAPRLLEPWTEGHDCVPLIAAADIAAYVDKAPRGPVGVLLSGDTGFYSGAKGLWPLLGNHEVITIPGISSLSYFCARLQTTWQDARLVSAHGRSHNAVGRSSAAPRSLPSPAGPPRRRTSAGPWPSGGWDRCGSPWASG